MWGRIALSSLVATVGLGSVLAFAGYNAMLVTPLMPLVIYSLARGAGAFPRFLSTPTMLLWGAVSYSLYMTHLIVLNAIAALMPSATSGLDGVLACIALLVCSLGTAHLTYRWVEEPARTFMRARSPQGRVVTEVEPQPTS